MEWVLAIDEKPVIHGMYHIKMNGGSLKETIRFTEFERYMERCPDLLWLKEKWNTFVERKTPEGSFQFKRDEPTSKEKIKIPTTNNSYDEELAACKRFIEQQNSRIEDLIYKLNSLQASYNKLSHKITQKQERAVAIEARMENRMIENKSTEETITLKSHQTIIDSYKERLRKLEAQLEKPIIVSQRTPIVPEVRKLEMITLTKGLVTIIMPQERFIAKSGEETIKEESASAMIIEESIKNLEQGIDVHISQRFDVRRFINENPNYKTPRKLNSTERTFIVGKYGTLMGRSIINKLHQRYLSHKRTKQNS